MSYESPISILVNEDGNIVTRSGSQSMATEQPGLPVMGKDNSGNAQFLKINAGGELQVAATVDVDLKAYADGGTDSVTVYGNLATLRQEGSAGEERLMVSGTVDLSGVGFESLITAINNVDSSVQDVSGAVDNLGLSVDVVNSSVQAVSGAVDALGGGSSLFSVNSSIQSVSGAIDNLGLSVDTLNSSVGDVNLSVQAVSGALAELVNNTLVNSATVSSMVASDGPDSVASLATRKGFIFFMEGSNTAYVKFGAGASSSDYSVNIIGPGGFYELSNLRYTGELSIAFKNATGILRITELT